MEHDLRDSAVNTVLQAGGWVCDGFMGKVQIFFAI